MVECAVIALVEAKTHSRGGFLFYPVILLARQPTAFSRT
jgi:hypothetical protein